MNFTYPSVTRDDSLVETIFGVKVADPYRALEDKDNEEIKRFVREQNELTDSYMAKCPHHSEIKKVLLMNQDYKKTGCTFKRGSNYYFFQNSGLQPQPVLFQKDSLDGVPRVFLDPNTLSEDGSISLNTSSFSHDGRYFAYSLSYFGSDWTEIFIKDAISGQDLDDKLTRIKYTSIAWTHDNNGFFYAAYTNYAGQFDGTSTEELPNQSVFYHTLRTNQSDDVLKLQSDRDDWKVLDFEISDDGEYFFCYPRTACHDNEWHYCDLSGFQLKDKLILKPILEEKNVRIDYLSNNGEVVYFKTNLHAENYRISKLNLQNPSVENWIDIVPNHPTDVLYWAEVYSVGDQDYLLINFLRKVVFQLELHELEGKLLKRFETPPGTLTKYSGCRGDQEIFYRFESFSTPAQNYYFDLKNLDQEPSLLSQAFPKNFSSEDSLVQQVFYPSADKTEIPMFIVHRRDMVKDGSNPCILYGYGGFNHMITQTFDINRFVWVKNFRGIFVVANIRGGGEFGQAWHDSGRLLNKQNCFDDFIAAAEYLISNKYTNHDKLAIEGGSNGGLLVAAVSNQRPELFGATICNVGVLDMIRYSSFTIGNLWSSDYGDPKQEIHFKNLINYSPYHNIPENTEIYPATLLITANHDDRVVPAHSYKFIAQLQHKLGKKLNDTPLLIRVETKSGHGMGLPTAKVVELYTDIYSFLYNTLRLDSFCN